MGAPWKPLPPDRALNEPVDDSDSDSIRASTWPVIIRSLPNPSGIVWGYSPERGNCAGAKAASFMKKPGLLGRFLAKRTLGGNPAEDMWGEEGSIVIPFPTDLNELFSRIAEDPSIFSPLSSEAAGDFPDVWALPAEAKQPVTDDPRSEASRDILRRAYELLSAKWCDGTLARDRDGRAVDPQSDEATAFSIEGAIDRAWVEARCPGDSQFVCHFNLGTAIDRLYPEFKARPEVAGLMDSDFWLAFNDAYGQEGARRVVLLAMRQIEVAASRS